MKPEIGDNLAALITSAGFVFLLIIVVLLRHQQKMAAILNRQAVDVQPNSDMARLQGQVAAIQGQMDEMRQLVGQQTFALEDLRTRLGALPATPPLPTEERFRQA